MSELDDHYVYRGVWVNQNDGSTMGRTITTDTRTSTIIVALLAVMSSIGATHLYNILLFAFHQKRASGGFQDALFLQQQALLRALPAPGSLATDAIKLWWQWRRKEGRVLFRCLLPALLALVFAASTLTASIFSSAIVSSSNIEVLVNSPYCGFRNFTRYYNEHGSFENDYVSTYESVGETWARNCYKSLETFQSGCRNVFVQPRIPVAVQEAECPFSPNMCAVQNSSAVVMDSGLLDMNKHFGFNLKSTDGVKFRRRTTCTVLPAQGYVRILNASELPPLVEHNMLDQPRYKFPLEQVEASLYGGFRMSNGTYMASTASGLQQATELRSLLYTNSSISYKAR